MRANIQNKMWIVKESEKIKFIHFNVYLCVWSFAPFLKIIRNFLCNVKRNRKTERKRAHRRWEFAWNRTSEHPCRYTQIYNTREHPALRIHTFSESYRVPNTTSELPGKPSTINKHIDVCEQPMSLSNIFHCDSMVWSGCSIQIYTTDTIKIIHKCECTFCKAKALKLCIGIVCAVCFFFCVCLLFIQQSNDIYAHYHSISMDFDIGYCSDEYVAVMWAFRNLVGLFTTNNLKMYRWIRQPKQSMNAMTMKQRVNNSRICFIHQFIYMKCKHNDCEKMTAIERSNSSWTKMFLVWP